MSQTRSMSSASSSLSKLGTSASATEPSARFAIMCRIRCRQLKSTIWLLFCGVLAMGGATSAHATGRQSTLADSVDHVQVSVDRDDIMAVATRGAPSLPFRGVIGYSGDFGMGYPDASRDSPVPEGLLYWSTADSTLGYVPLGDMRNMCGPGLMIARPDGVEVIHVQHSGPLLAGYQIPWGDDAYPRFVFSSEVFLGPTTVKVSDDFQVEVVHDDETQTHGVLRISRGAERRFYEAALPGPRFLGSEYVSQEREYYEPTVGLSGTDGEHYGYRIIPNEPACGPQMTIVVSAMTGESVMCGWDLLGPVLVNFDGSYTGVEDTVFPVDEPSMSAVDCEKRMNVFELGRNTTGDSDKGAMS